MKILALDTSTLTGSVAIVDGGVVLMEVSSRVRATHSEELLPLVDAALRGARMVPADLDLLAVGIGPGSFTGVRIGLATAKGLRLAHDCPLVGVSSLEALAASAFGAGGPVLATLDARRDEVYAAGYVGSTTGRATWLAPRHARPELVGRQVLEVARAPVLVVGDLDDALYARLTGEAGDRFVRAPRVAGTPLARFVAWEALQGHGRVDDGTLEPCYLRPSDALLPAGKAGAP